MSKLRQQKQKPFFSNPAENAFAQTARANGWEVFKTGYPDFICYKGSELMLVEVKPKKGGRLKLSQARLMNKLAEKGIKCYKWSPDSDFFQK